MTANGSTYAPGRVFLNANAKGARCIAACLKITYPGSESTRSGRVHYGLTSAGLIDLNGSAAPDLIAQSLQHYGRTPADTIEVFWKPNVGDTEFNDPSEAASAVIRDRKSAITVAWAGLPAGVGLTFHMTAVYEWTPGTGYGVGHNAMGKARSVNSLDDVLDTLIGGGFNFVRNFGETFTPYAGRAAGAAAAMAFTSRAFGLMPTAQRVRNIRGFAV